MLNTHPTSTVEPKETSSGSPQMGRMARKRRVRELGERALEAQRHQTQAEIAARTHAAPTLTK